MATHYFGIYSEMIVSGSKISAIFSKVEGSEDDSTGTES